MTRLGRVVAVIKVSRVQAQQWSNAKENQELGILHNNVLTTAESSQTLKVAAPANLYITCYPATDVQRVVTSFMHDVTSRSFSKPGPIVRRSRTVSECNGIDTKGSLLRRTERLATENKRLRRVAERIFRAVAKVDERYLMRKLGVGARDIACILEPVASRDPVRPGIWIRNTSQP